MPSKKAKSPAKSQAPRTSVSRVTKPSFLTHVAFIPLLSLVFIVWVAYRVLFHFPIWFDESVGKAVFFGLPVWLYISMTRSNGMKATFSIEKIKPGLLLGVAVGGVFGFSATIAALIRSHAVVQTAPLFTSDLFWGQFLLALFTGFWETLFFYTWVMVIVQEKFRHWPAVNQLLMIVTIFMVFHLPNTILRFNGWQVIVGQLVLLGFFATGQALLFWRTRNFYALTLSHAIWGMVLLVHAW
jgi:hypothetical protein